MSKLSINLTPALRLDLRLIKRRGGSSITEFFNQERNKLRRIRSGNKISRIFRQLFEHDKVKRLLGTNLAIAILVSSFIPRTSPVSAESENRVISLKEVPIETIRETALPLDKIVISQGYGLFHLGVDFDGLTGDEIRSIKKGVVVQVQKSRFAYGNAVLVRHEAGLTSLYAHLSKITVEEGQEVDTFTKLGEMGATGRASGDHLHLEVYKNGLPINPRAILPF
ncbi:hypothetical protein A2382_04220 [Candidatus Woesebacteria bacterium RIFOXYB1_FULL_38_16]|uniref:M23ase beta-sheet core domain-containing protein n=1 Tax=Candidatus Woesebacteria bacterium RIFOXYB1_FULL_38_16 TaxID=1802538 RepID=A0A1F8CUL2_9BACT|nr:MAG: hypothetical protein A2191_04295 [Candidatus Woesebacteria bacterium RIFOXYA1_FULL_38_9]OGM79776.1 MAG: hypothetical protein A2382_04220 [Candidatus Woesebacteria bacterium RIFOXYB1_FULL_38_16]